MARRKRHNPERRTWRGRSHKHGGKRVRQLRYTLDARRKDERDEAGRQVCRLWKLA